MIRALIVDDEPLPRSKVRAFLKPHRDFQVLEECVGGEEAADAILRLKPDVESVEFRYRYGSKPKTATLFGVPI